VSGVLKIVFDIDGTLSDPSHRLHHIQGARKDWDGFFAACRSDAPLPHMVELARSMMARHEVQFWTGRPERTRTDTHHWLLDCGLAWTLQHREGFVLRMRADGDHRPDDIVKLEYLDAGWTPDLIFEDRSRVVDAFRARGIAVAQVARGDF
jgi:hypothetical protein